jgi:hypothetical protein
MEWMMGLGVTIAHASRPWLLAQRAVRDGRTDQPMASAISMGVRRDDPELKARLEEVLERRRPEIQRLLASYAVPIVGSAPSAADDDDD